MYDVLEAEGDLFGIDQKKISWVVSGQQYMQMVMIAAGELPGTGRTAILKIITPGRPRLSTPPRQRRNRL